MATTRYCARCLNTFASNAERCPNLGCAAARPTGGWPAILSRGDLLDRRYRIDRCIAVGGAGLTYLAQEVDDDGKLVGKLLAIKVLYNARASGTFLKRLSTEAQILQDLAHEHIVQYHAFVQRQGVEPYLVTLFESGGNLSQHVERHGPLQASIAAGVLKQILLALDVAHQRGVVHRDLKPDNVLLYGECDKDCVPLVRVADFGIAKVQGTGTDRLTKIGSFVGTPEYAAPEQFEGEDPTAATDMFATGALFLYLLTGRKWISFSHRSDIRSSFDELLEALPPTIRLPDSNPLDPEQSSRVENIIEHMMALDPEDRCTVQQVLLQLRPLLEEANFEPHNTLELTGSGAPDRRLGPPAVTFTMPPESAAGQPVLNPSAPTVPRVPAAGRVARLRGPEALQSPESLVSEHSEPRKKAVATPAPNKRVDLSKAALEVPEAPSGSGLLGCMGISFLGAGFSAAVAVVSVLAVWLIAGGAFYLTAPQNTIEPVFAEASPPDLKNAFSLHSKGKKANRIREQVEADLKRKTKSISKTCKVKGLIKGELMMKANGAVSFARVDPGYLPPDRVPCVVKELSRLSFDFSVPTHTRLRFSVTL